VLQPLCQCGVECAIYHEQDVCEEEHPYVSDTNKQYLRDHGIYSLLLLVKFCVLATQALRLQQ